MSNSGSAANTGQAASNTLKDGITKIHGVGEAIRGNINSFADGMTNTSSAKSDNVAARGVDEMETGKYQGTGAGVTPHDTARERLNRDVQGEGGHVGTGSAVYGSTGSRV